MEDLGHGVSDPECEGLIERSSHDSGTAGAEAAGAVTDSRANLQNDGILSPGSVGSRANGGSSMGLGAPNQSDHDVRGAETSYGANERGAAQSSSASKRLAQTVGTPLDRSHLGSRGRAASPTSTPQTKASTNFSLSGEKHDAGCGLQRKGANDSRALTSEDRERLLSKSPFDRGTTWSGAFQRSPFEDEEDDNDEFDDDVFLRDTRFSNASKTKGSQLNGSASKSSNSSRGSRAGADASSGNSNAAVNLSQGRLEADFRYGGSSGSDHGEVIGKGYFADAGDLGGGGGSRMGDPSVLELERSDDGATAGQSAKMGNKLGKPAGGGKINLSNYQTYSGFSETNEHNKVLRRSARAKKGWWHRLWTSRWLSFSAEHPVNDAIDETAEFLEKTDYVDPLKIAEKTIGIEGLR